MKLNKRYIGVNGKLAFDVGYYDGNDKSAQAYKSWYKMLMRCVRTKTSWFIWPVRFQGY